MLEMVIIWRERENDVGQKNNHVNNVGGNFIL